MLNMEGHTQDMLGRDAQFYLDLFSALDNNAVLREKNEDGVFVPVSCTREFTDMMECTAREFIQAETENPLCTVIPEDRIKAEYLLAHGTAQDGENHVIVRKRTMRGKLIWVDLHYAIFESSGHQYAYCNYFNVTTLKETEQRMRVMHDELNKELRTISNESLAVIRSNLTKGVVEEISGRDLFDGDVVGARMEDLLRVRLNSMPMEADRKRYLEHFSTERSMEAYARGEDLEPLVIFSRRQSGRQCFVRYSASMRKDPISGDITIFGIETEYNSEKVNEVLNQKVLAQQYDMISYVTDGSYGVVIGDAARIAKGSIFPVEMNGSYEEYIKRQVLPVVSGGEEERERIEQALSLSTIEEELDRAESYAVPVVCSIDGETFYKRFTFYMVDPEARFYILLKSDYTELQREQMRRTEQLKAALEEANQANVAKTAFLSSMSHEIRTPMNAIIGLDNIALNEPGLTGRTRTHLEQIGSSARHLLSLINDILDMSRIESGRMVLRHEEFSFGRMLEQVNTIVSGQCRDKGIRYDCFVHGKIDEYYIGDDMKLKQVLINILGNSVKFTPEGGHVTLDIQRVAQFSDKTSLRFIIRDTGIGMDADYLPKIFLPFSQEDSSMTNKYGGTGLGLAITKNIVEMMSGEIGVESEKGKGTTFTVMVTLSNAGIREIAHTPINPQDIRALVIDDDPIACEHAQIVLEEVGIPTETCLKGSEALSMIKTRAARREPYNLILVDLHMPEMDGIEVSRRIRGLVGKETAIIILTAYSWDDVMDEALAAGVDCFMAKPLFPNTVLEEFTQAISMKSLFTNQMKLADLNGRHILLVEDVQINAMIMQQLLAMKNMTVDLAENGQEAVDAFVGSPEGSYDAILMDVRMPVMDGLEATETIRALPRGDSATVPIIALTANAFDEDVQRSLQAGMNAHLSKPIEPERLYQALGELIRD